MGAHSDRFTSTPPDWEKVPSEVVEHARSVTLEALDWREARQRNVVPAVERLGAYYDREGNYAGSTYLGVEPHDPNEFTVADLHAVTLLRVEIGALSTRRFTEVGPARTRLVALLSDLPVDTGLAEADERILIAMAALHEEVKRKLARSERKAPPASG